MSLLDDVRAIRSLPSPAVARQIREQAGVTQGRMAEELGVHFSTLARWEAGISAPPGQARAKWARLIAELQRELAA